MSGFDAAVGRPTDRIALDANLMLTVDARRFLCAMQELTGGAVLVGRQAYAETWHRSADFGRRGAERSVGHMVSESGRDWTRRDHDRMDDLAWANTQGWREWMSGERRRNDAAWAYVGSPKQADRLQSAILGSGALTDNQKKAQDAMVIAEAILSGAHIVASDNLRSIRHAVLNNWLAKKKSAGHVLLQHVPVPFLLDPDAAVACRCEAVAPNNPDGHAPLQWAMGACAPTAPVAAPQLDGILRRFLDNVHDAGAQVTAQAAERRLDDMQALNPDGWMDELRTQSPPAHRTRDAESRRLDLVRSWSP